MTETEGPIFIGGPHRSGTGMLRALIGANSAVAIPPKEYLFFETVSSMLTAPFVGSFEYASPGEKEKLLQAILGSPKIQLWGITEEDVQPFLPMRSLKDLYAAPLMGYARRVRKRRFGDKTPFLERNFAQLFAWFGASVRFVQIVRDPFETYLSALHYKHFAEPPLVMDFARQWKLSLVTGVHYSRTSPLNYRLIRYSDFVRNPEHETKLLCEFCNLPDETDVMLVALEDEQSRNSSFRKANQLDPHRDEREPVRPVLPQEAQLMLEKELSSCLDFFSPSSR